MDKKQGQNTLNTGIGVGGTSILAIFVVLCLVTLASLSLVSAQADYGLTKKTAEAAQEYYAADAQAERQLAVLTSAVEAGGDIDAVAGNGIEIKEIKDKSAILSYTIQINQHKNLYVEIELGLDAVGKLNGEWARRCWETQLVESDDDGTETLNLLQ